MEDLIRLNNFIDKTIQNVTNDGNEIVFETSDGETWIMYDGDCGANIFLEEVIGDLNSLIGSPIINAICESRELSLDELESKSEDNYSAPSKSMWSEFKLSTDYTTVTIKWFRESSENMYVPSVDFRKLGLRYF